MADGGGITYTVTADTSEYDSSIKKAGETAKSTFSEVDKSAKNAATGTDKLTEAKERLMRKIERLKQAIEEQAAEVQKASNEYGVNSEQADKAAEKQYQLEKQLEAAEKQLAKMDDTMSDASKDMGTMSDAADDASKAVDNLGDDAKTASKDEKSLGDEAKTAGDKVDKMAQRAEAGGKKIETAFKRAFTAIGAAVGASIGMGVNFNKQMETYQTSFEVMTGSYETAANLVEELKNRAAATPFDLTDLADTTQLLMNYGFTTDNVISSMEMLGDIAQGDADKLTRVATAYGQMSSAGKVSLEDVKQMIEAGFNPLQEITETTGESMASLYDRISKGTISVDEITAAMIRSTSEGGKYYKSMDKQSQTLQGRWNTLKDTFAEATGKLTKGISDWLSNKGIPAANKAIEWLSENFEDLVPIIETVIAAAAGFYVAFKFQDVIKGIQDVGAALATGSGLAGLVVGALAAMAVVITNAYIEANKASTYFTTLSEHLEEIHQTSQNTIESIGNLETSFNKFGLETDLSTQKANEYLATIDKISEDGVLATDEQDAFNAAIAMLQTLYPDLQIEIDETTGLIKDGTNAIRDQIEMMNQQAMAAALQNHLTQAYEALSTQTINLTAAQGEYDRAVSKTNNFYATYGGSIDKVNALMGTNYKTVKDCVNGLAGWTGATETQTEEARQLYNDLVGLTGVEAENAQAVEKSKAKYDEAKEAYDTASAAAEGYEYALEEAIKTGDYSAESVGKNYDKIVSKSHEMRSNVENDAEDAAQAVANGGSGSGGSGGGGWGGAAGVATRELQNKFQPNLRRAGINAAQGAIDGMLSKLSELKSTAKYLASQVNGSFNAWLKIRSPSRVMMESGKFVVEGVAEGIEDAAHVAERAAADLGKGVETSFDMRMATPDMDAMAAGAALQSVQTSELYSNIAAQMTSAPIHVHLDVDGTEIAEAIALPMSYSLESLRIAEARG